ncbi:MAG: carbon starvation protein A, partial [candidate division NC10 bacterium]|nr:carbon starvation protein A [candidate division NC10 bacterium]
MNSLVALLIGLLVAILGYQIYSKRIDRRVMQSDPRKTTPATMYMDGVDFTPASKNVLFGYQFKSIAALGPILGPIIAVQWGWLPALLWIIGGCLFIGWVQDYSSTMVAVRNEGMTFGGLSYKLISPRARIILLTFIYFYLLLIMAAFSAIVAGLLTNPKVPLGFVAMTLTGLLAGQRIYRWKRDIILTTVVTVVVSFVGIYLGTLPAVAAFFKAINGGEKPPILFGTVTQA